MEKKKSFNSPKFNIGNIVMNLNESFLLTGDSEYGGTKYRVGKIIYIDNEYTHSIKYTIKHQGQKYINIPESCLELYDATKDMTIEKKIPDKKKMKKKQRREIGKKEDIEKNNKLEKIKIQNRNREKTKQKRGKGRCLKKKSDDD